MKVLVVEDDLMFAHILKIRLVMQGHLVDLAKNQKEAIEKSKKEKYETVVSDIYLPDSHCVSDAKKLKKYFPNTRMLFMSGSPEKGVEDKSKIMEKI